MNKKDAVNAAHALQQFLDAPRPFPEIVTCGLVEARTFIPGADHVIISIVSKSAPDPVLCEGWHDLLRLKFDDIDGEHDDACSVIDANEIARFAFQHRRAKRLVVHCEAGKRRSVSAAAALSMHIGNKRWRPEWMTKDQRIPNAHVYKRVRNAANAIVMPALERQLRAVAQARGLRLPDRMVRQEMAYRRRERE
jgi:predicted protein tyrosine phosphatase